MKDINKILDDWNCDGITLKKLALIHGGDLGATLKCYRQSAGLTARELARQMNITPATLSNYENNKRRPDLEFIRDVSQQLHFSADTLLKKI
ncbi:helix-turn-helix transcriptional regulator [Leuconostoc carnosum]|uniref:helix-turn-helix domain-containing protein n=1 Tax=Leuconostoc carnosum TaxID=1252 RepID=UPI00123A3E71|nr:helix-turn-helix transcriptional regulator [Leuconostoc carnosum]KAA8369465.1 helix-turn-helix transcriptional regulator [Leuconostoc carnosum]KAA8380484.1 helix-turn-helix transcriptional regulator [Leuconostoc carnosum]